MIDKKKWCRNDGKSDDDDDIQQQRKKPLLQDAIIPMHDETERDKELVNIITLCLK